MIALLRHAADKLKACSHQHVTVQSIQQVPRSIASTDIDTLMFHQPRTQYCCIDSRLQS